MESKRYGIGEWYGNLFPALNPEQKIKYANIKGVKKEICPHRNDIDFCNKSGGVCTMAVYSKNENGEVRFDIDKNDLVTLCPNRFWQQNKVFMEIGRKILGIASPTLIKEVNFLQRIDSDGNIKNDFVGKIDLILTKNDVTNNIIDWCAIELQAVYFSGMAMNSEFMAIKKEPDELLFPEKIRRPDFRSSGPKRLMPQLEIKVPTLRRWGKKMAIVIDKPFYESIAPMKNVSSLSNADIAWFVVNYDNPQNELNIYKILFTTLESSVEGLTSGIPISKEKFENELSAYLTSKSDKLIRLFNQ